MPTSGVGMALDTRFQRKNATEREGFKPARFANLFATCYLRCKFSKDMSFANLESLLSLHGFLPS